MALKCHCGNPSQFCPLRSAYRGKSTPELMPRRKTRRNLSEESTFGQKTARAWAYKTDVKGMAVRFQAFDADPGLASSIKDESRMRGRRHLDTREYPACFSILKQRHDFECYANRSPPNSK